jgi:beta-glucosidase-like glycosyl hydrolase
VSTLSYDGHVMSDHDALDASAHLWSDAAAAEADRRGGIA